MIDRLIVLLLPPLQFGGAAIVCVEGCICAIVLVWAIGRSYGGVYLFSFLGAREGREKKEICETALDGCVHLS